MLDRVVEYPDASILTVSSNEYGTLTAEPFTGFEGDTASLTATPNEDCHFVNYDVTGGSINNNTFTFTNVDATAKANFARNVHNVTVVTSNYGKITSNKSTGYSGDIVTLSNTPSADCTFSSYSVTGATLTGNQFMMKKADVSAKGNFYRNTHNITTLTSNYGTIAANKSTAYSGDTVILSNTPAADCHFNSYSITGATLTGSNFKMGTSNVSAKGSFSRNVHNLTLQTNGHGTISANNTTGYSGTQITLNNTPDEDYSFTRYDITGATLTSDKFKFGTSDVTAKAIFTQIPTVSSYCYNTQNQVFGQLHQGTLPFSTRSHSEYGNCVIANTASYVVTKFTMNMSGGRGVDTILFSGNDVWKAAGGYGALPTRMGTISQMLLPGESPDYQVSAAFGEPYSALYAYTGLDGVRHIVGTRGSGKYQYIFDRTSNMGSAYQNNKFICSGPINTFSTLHWKIGMSANNAYVPWDIYFSAISVSQFNKKSAAFQFMFA